MPLVPSLSQVLGALVSYIYQWVQEVREDLGILLGKYDNEPKTVETTQTVLQLIDPDDTSLLADGDSRLLKVSEDPRQIPDPTEVDTANEASTLHRLAVDHLQRFRRGGDLDDLEQAIAACQRAVNLTPPGDPDLPTYVDQLGATQQVRFKRHGSLVDLDNAISNGQLAISLTPGDHPARRYYLNHLGGVLSLRFQRHGSLVDLEDAVSNARLAVSLTPESHLDRPKFLISLGDALIDRFSRHRSLTDLEDAISSARLAVSLTPDDHPEKPEQLQSLGNSLGWRFHQHGSLADLEDAISNGRLAVSLSPDGDPEKPERLHGLGNSLMGRFSRHGLAVDLDDAISNARLAVSLTPDDHPEKPRRLHKLGNALQWRFGRHGSLTDLEDAISSAQLAVSLIPDDHPEKPELLHSLGGSLVWRFSRHGSLADLEDAISNARLAVSLTPDDHPHKPKRLHGLGIALQGRFERQGSLADLEDAISNARLAVSLTPDDHPEKPARLQRLGNALHWRFSRHGSLVDLEDAIANARLAASLTPDGHLERPNRIHKVGGLLHWRFDRHGSLVDLEDAISNVRLAVSLTPEGHPERSRRLHTLGSVLQGRFGRHGSLTDLEDAILNMRLAVSLTPDDHPDKPARLNSLGKALLSRYSRQDSLADLEDAVFNVRLAVSLTPDHHPRKLDHLQNLAVTLRSRYKRLGDSNDLQSSILAARTSAQLSTGSSKTQLGSARLWAECCSLGLVSPLPAFECAVNLLPRVAWLGLAVDDQYALLAAVGKTARNAVAAVIAEEEYARAAEWAEQSRSIVWQNLLSLRTPLDELRYQHTELATRLNEVSQQLEQPVEATRSLDGLRSALSPDQQMTLARRREELVDEVRSKPGFERFLSPKTLDELAPAVQDGPVVFLNLAEERCDAVVIYSDKYGGARVLLVTLDRVTAQKTEELSKRFVELLAESGVRARDVRTHRRLPKFADKEAAFKQILRTLWLDYTQPVIESLAYQVYVESPPRLWWCTTGPLAFLPLHAAGDYDSKEAGNKLSDYVISSYTPTLTALLEQSPPKTDEELKILTVAMSKTPGGENLPSVDEETEKLLRIVANVPTISLSNEEATKDRVLEGLQQSSWIHLACHGQQIGGKPMESGLLLHDGMLELSQIVKTRLPNADFAFLSACQTAVGDEGVPEESAHLAAGMLFAGYRGVVATMWSIQDDIAPRVAEEFYRYMFRNGKPDRKEAAYALHKAVGSLRESGVGFESWVPFIYMGR